MVNSAYQLFYCIIYEIYLYDSIVNFPHTGMEYCDA